MTGSHSSTAEQPIAALRQTRRAWLVIALATAGFALLASLAVLAVRYYYIHATVKEPARVRVISGSGALWRSDPSDEWRLIDGEVEIQEGDQISTALGTVAWVTLFDGSTVEISEDSIVTIARSRSSRFLQRTKDVVLDLQRGSVYVAMSPHGEYRYSRIRVNAHLLHVEMSDEPGRSEAGSFLVEVSSPPAAPAGSIDHVRTAVLRGAAMLVSGDEQLKLFPDQQVIAEAEGEIGPVTPAIRELIANGDFEDGLSGWLEVHDSVPAASTAAAGVVELRPATIDGEVATAVEFARTSTVDDIVITGIRQRIGQTLRIFSSLRLAFDLRINSHGPIGPAGSEPSYPFTIELNYVDLSGQERTWRHSYFAVGEGSVPTDRAAVSQVAPGSWTHISFDLNNLEPLPKQIVSVVVYASGANYQCLVANLSLTSSEQATGP